MDIQKYASFFALAALGVTASCTPQEPDGQAIGAVTKPLTGAIFTTTEDGSRVDANIYAAKEDVYLDGGPGNKAPAKAAGLPEGDYYFQVTDPSGKTLLSTDAIECREFHVSADGVIDSVRASPCAHLTGIDMDHANLGAITVQLMPYDDTPNNGGEYKVWVTPVDDYADGLAGKHGFIDALSKTDNFKVLSRVTQPVCGNGVLEEGEACDDGNNVDGDGCSADCMIEKKPVCGDGVLDPGEECDDGNLMDGDGCSSMCTREKPCLCGNGVVDPGEECDDGNLVDGDGCSSTCTFECPTRRNG
jgi:cysteine-rich repeat protein